MVVAIDPIIKYFLPQAIVSGALQADNHDKLDLLRHDGVTRQALAQGELIVENLATQPAYHSSFNTQENLQAFAALTLHNRRQKPLAVLYLNFRQPRSFDAEDRKILRLFAGQSSSVLQNTWLLRRHQEVAHIGQEINQELATARSLFEKLQAHVSGIIDISHTLMLAIYRPQDNRLDLFLTEAEQSFELLNQELGSLPGCEWVIAQRQRLVINSLEQEAELLPIQLVDITGNPETDPESLIFVPLLLRGVPLGVLSVQHLQQNAYDIEDLHILELLANHVALALSNIRLYDNVRQLNETGQFLTRQLDSIQTLQDVVHQIRSITGADIVVLFPYVQVGEQFEFPPRVSGELLEPHYPAHHSVTSDDVAVLMLEQNEAIFAKDSTELYIRLGGDPQIRQGSFERREQIRSTAAVPLRVGLESVGVLFVNFRRPQRFDAPQKLLITGLGSYAAIAIKNSREFDALTQRRVRELQVLQAIDREMSKTLELDKVLYTILHLTTEHIAAYKASIFLYDERNQVLETKAFYSPKNAAYLQDLVISAAERRGLVWWAFEHATPVRSANVLTDPQWRDLYIPVANNILAEMDVPLLAEERAIGVINFASNQEAAFTQADEDFLVTLAGQAVLAIKNAQAYEREKRLAAERQELIEINREMSRSLNSQQIMQTILERAIKHIPADSASIFLYNSRTEILMMEAATGRHAPFKGKFFVHRNENKGITRWAFENRRAVRVANVQTDPKWRDIHKQAATDTLSEMDIPLLDDNEVVGIINFESTQEAAFSQADENFLRVLAGQAVIAIKNAQSYKRAEERQARLNTLHEVDQKIISQLDDPDLVIQLILDSALTLTRAETADIDLYKQDQPNITYLGRVDSRTQKVRVERVDAASAATHQVKRGIVAHVARTKQPYRTIGEAQDDPYYVGEPDIHSEVAVPLLSRSNTLVGVLNLESRQRQAFSDEDIEVLQLFAGQAVIAIQNAGNYARADRDLLRFRLLHQAGGELGEIADL
ncbi:MAG: GAF domain-containing protein, partial [Chloroflexales bacterium]|nr:GAF domain-containing protein [Chloroflexales bacterium]